MSKPDNTEDLPKFSKKEVFKVPDGYFEDFPNRLQARIAREQEKKRTWQWAEIMPAYGWRVALPVAAAMLLAILLFRPQPEEKAGPEALLAKADTEALENYLFYSRVQLEEIAETAPEMLETEWDVLPEEGTVPLDKLEDELLLEEVELYL